METVLYLRIYSAGRNWFDERVESKTWEMCGFLRL